MEPATASVTPGFVLSGLIIGVVFGFILQRGQFCMNAAFRDTIFMKDFTMFRAYLIALVIMVIGANILQDMGAIVLKRQTFYPLANTIGGYIFGIGMVLAEGCGSGIIYRTGEGLLSAWFAVFGFFIGIGATTNGILTPLLMFLKNESLSLPLSGKPNAALWELIGNGPAIKWSVIFVLAFMLSFFILRGKPFTVKKREGLSWPVTGVFVGVMGVVAFWASEFWGGGFARGLSFTSPTGELFFTVLTGNAKSRFFPMFNLGPFQTTWAAFYIIGVPLGSYVSAKALTKFAWRVPSARQLVTVIVGSIMMGFGAVLAGGCNVGQALTGFATLSIGSIVATVAIIAGNWTMVYFKFIKPMQD
ncbi:MAG: YeeE/YedE family protein [Nitrospirae bacterium]|nr:YeeE/YedE family protein [Nitrospirota bacterium]